MPKTIAAYTHPSPALDQTPDPWVNPGGPNWRTLPCYYASVVDGSRHGLLAGPYKSHVEALAAVPQARFLAQKHDPRAAFYGFGTCKVATGERDGIFGVLE